MLWKKNKDGKAAFSQSLLPLVTCDVLTHMALQTLKAWERMTKGGGWRDTHMYWKVYAWGTCLPSVSKHTEKSWGQRGHSEGAHTWHLESVHTWHSESVHTGHAEGVHTGPWPSCFPSRYQHELVGQQEPNSSSSFTPPSLQLLPVWTISSVLPPGSPSPPCHRELPLLWCSSCSVYLAASHTRHSHPGSLVYPVDRALASCEGRACGELRWENE